MLVRLEAARRVYNACLGEAKRRVGLVRQSKLFQRARLLPKDDPERQRLFAQARKQYGLREYDLHHYATTLRTAGPGTRLDANTIQKLATRAHQAANRLLLGQARRIRFKGKNQLDNVEGKLNAGGIRWRGDRAEWSGLVLPGLLVPRDPVQQHALASRVKYVRLVRRKMGAQQRFFAQW